MNLFQDPLSNVMKKIGQSKNVTTLQQHNKGPHQSFQNTTSTSAIQSAPKRIPTRPQVHSMPPEVVPQRPAPPPPVPKRQPAPIPTAQSQQPLVDLLQTELHLQQEKKPDRQSTWFADLQTLQPTPASSLVPEPSDSLQVGATLPSPQSTWFTDLEAPSSSTGSAWTSATGWKPQRQSAPAAQVPAFDPFGTQVDNNSGTNKPGMIKTSGKVQSGKTVHNTCLLFV